MGRHSLSNAEQGFFSTLFDDGERKLAVDLNPDTVDALGIPSVSPSVLSQLENQAAKSTDAPTPEESPEEQAPIEATETEGGDVSSESVEIDPFERTDEEPDEEYETFEDWYENCEDKWLPTLDFIIGVEGEHKVDINTY